MLDKLRILVAEDNLLNQKVAGFILQKNGAVITQALNGEQAIDLLKRNNFDVILMDLYMPETDGFAATAYIRQTMENNIPIIAITASNFDHEHAKCIEAGMNACICKPFETAVLCETILKVLKDNKEPSKKTQYG